MRNNRLKKLINMEAPEIIVLNEKRMLQEIVDALIDNSPRTNTATTEGGRPLNSIGTNLKKGKKGLLRDKMLGKRVDHSGRSVITVGGNLKLYECGLPKEMALVLFEPFIIQRLKKRNLIKTFKQGKQLLEQKPPVVWSVLENLVKDHPILLNRAPTLHRLGIQAFYPKLIEGKSIQLHPLVCTAFNADFDGDQMAVHVPLSQEAIAEAALLLLSRYNMINPSNGEPITVPSKDMVLGYYFLTLGIRSTPDKPVKGEGKYFSNAEEVIIALNNKKLDKHAYIKLHLEKQGTSRIIETVAGRVVFNQCLPKEIPFINEVIDGSKIRNIVGEVYKKAGIERTARFLDEVKDLGFQYAYQGGLTYGLDDMKPPKEKDGLIKKAQEEVTRISESYYLGFITDTERYNQVIDVWSRFTVNATKLVLKRIHEDKHGHNTIDMFIQSKARGSSGQIQQTLVARGLMAKPHSQSDSKGSIIEQPILSSFLDGLSAAEYFISTHGGRKGLSDTTIKTADAGYFTRRLVDAAQRVVITEKDCKTIRGRTVYPIYENGQLSVSLGSQVIGRTTVQCIEDPVTKDVLFRKGTLITEEIAQKIDQVGLVSLQVRSPIYCEVRHGGICTKCYGINLATHAISAVGDVVGNIAAQSISEPGTQLTLRTFHTGGAVAGNITEDSVKSLEEGIVKIQNLKTVVKGKNVIVINRGCELKVLSTTTQQEIQSHVVPYGALLLVNENQKVRKGQLLFEWDPYMTPIITTISGTTIFKEIEEGVTYSEEYNEQTGHKEKVIIDSKNKHRVPNITVDDGVGNTVSYVIPPKAQLCVEENEKIEKGTVLAKTPRPRSKPQDIVGGLPQVIKLFEMQRSTNSPVVASIDGQVTFGNRQRGNQFIIITNKAGTQKKYKVPLSSQLLVQEGDYVKAGDSLSDGLLCFEDILHVKGLDTFCNQIINAVQSLYRVQGIIINDKHLEIILKQMLQKLEIVHAGDTSFIPTQLVSKDLFHKTNKSITNKKVIVNSGDTHFKKGQLVLADALKVENKAMEKKGLATAEARSPRPATAKVKVQGITASASSSDSFIAAASFQETIKRLVKAIIAGEVDELRGIKENAVVGKLFSAGTGMKKFQQLRITSKEVEQVLAKSAKGEAKAVN